MSGVLPDHVSFPDAPAGAPCPACGAAGARVVYALAGVPVHSCVLLDDAPSARAFPTGDLTLAACERCGFLFNAAFESGKLDYSEDYEETQGCSTTFTTWLTGVAQALLAHTRPGETVVEVGCGRGDFLALLCRLGDLFGIGIDPSGTAGRVDRDAGRGLSFLREELGEAHAALAPDLVTCRHTLEHIGPVADFARLLRAAAARGLLFIEVPDVQRVLDEGAFWDVYYEHCSYFSVGSLGRLLQTTGLDVLRAERVYGEQYLQVLARPAATPAASIEDDRARLRDSVAAFRTTCRAALAHWHAVLEAARAAGQRVALWGSGSKGTAFLTTLGAEVDAVVDINPEKHGRFVAGAGAEIVAPEALRDVRPDVVIAMNAIYEREIARELERLGLAPRLLCLGG